MEDCLRGLNLRALGGGVDSPETGVGGNDESVGDWTFPSTSCSGRGPGEGLGGTGEFISTLET